MAIKIEYQTYIYFISNYEILAKITIMLYFIRS